MSIGARSFKPGQLVYHQRLGRGVVLEEWGAWVDVDDRGNQLAINGKGIFEIQFQDSGQRSINGIFLQHNGFVVGLPLERTRK